MSHSFRFLPPFSASTRPAVLAFPPAAAVFAPPVEEVGGSCPPSPPIKVCLTSPPSPREKESTAQATPKRRWLRQVWEKSKFVTGSSSKLAKQPNNHKTVAHIINPGEITRFVHAIDLAWQTYNSAPACMILMVTMGWPSEFTELAISQTCDC